MTVDKFDPDWPCDVIDQQGSRCPTVITSSHWTATERDRRYSYYAIQPILYNKSNNETKIPCQALHSKPVYSWDILHWIIWFDHSVYM